MRACVNGRCVLDLCRGEFVFPHSSSSWWISASGTHTHTHDREPEFCTVSLPAAVAQFLERLACCRAAASTSSDSRLIWMIDVRRHHYATWTGFTNALESRAPWKGKPGLIKSSWCRCVKPNIQTSNFLCFFVLLCSYSSDSVVLQHYVPDTQSAGWRGTDAKLFFFFQPSNVHSWVLYELSPGKLALNQINERFFQEKVCWKTEAPTCCMCEKISTHLSHRLLTFT